MNVAPPASPNEFAVRFNGVTRAIGSCRAVDGVTASFKPSKIHAILGENGAGKSTLMKLLFGLSQPSEGSIEVDGVVRHWRTPADAIGAGLGMVQQHFTLVETLSVIDNIMLGYESVSFGGVLNRSRAIKELESALPSKALSLDWNRMVSDLSVGEKQKVEILKLIARDAKILVLDEPTAVLSPQEIDGLFAILKGLRDQGRTIFVITHKLAEVFEHCDTWFVLRAGKSTGAGEVRTAKLEHVIRAMVGTTVPPLGLRARAKAGGAELSFTGVSVLNRENTLQDLSFDVKSGEILGIAGVDGSGQSEIVDALLGLNAFKGEIEVLGKTMPNEPSPDESASNLRKLREDGLALVSEDRHSQALWLDETPTVNAGLGFERQNGFVKNGWLSSTTWQQTTDVWIKAFDVRFLSKESPTGRLSGGNQQKLIFARELLARPLKLIVVHQPTRGVDFAAIRLIHERILEARTAGVAVLLISSELDELIALSDRMLVLCGGRATGRFDRSYSGAAFDREKIGGAMTGAHA